LAITQEFPKYKWYQNRNQHVLLN